MRLTATERVDVEKFVDFGDPDAGSDHVELGAVGHDIERDNAFEHRARKKVDNG